MTQEKNANNVSFMDLPIDPDIKDILAKYFTTPTPIQGQVIPHAIDGKDLVGIAQTGTGKTLAFGIPMIQKLIDTKDQGLVLVPTRELALQVEETMQKIGRPLGLKTAVIIGGAAQGPQIAALRREPNIVIATPGRLADHIQHRNYNLNKVSMIVLDEADRMFDIGFMKQIKEILSLAPPTHQTLLFSATMPAEIAQIAAHHMKTPLRIEVAPAGTANANVIQEIYVADRDTKMQLLEHLLYENQGTVLIFTRTKFGAKKIAAEIRHLGHTSAEIHSNRSLAQRREALDGFKSGKYRILVATDIAARGIDVKDISIVINYDLPENPEDYVHRIGRTGRAGSTGRAISFAAGGERRTVVTIEKLIKKMIPIISLPKELPPKRKPLPTSRDFESGPRSGGRSFGGAGRSSSSRPSSGGRGPSGPGRNFSRPSRPGGFKRSYK
ncbi:MAG: DEAD/DEAH box helicase [Patescibacteria group bacterium]